METFMLSVNSFQSTYLSTDDGPDVSTIAKIAVPCVLGVVIIIVCIALYVRGRRGRRGSYTVGPCDEKLPLGDVKGACE